MEDDANTFIEDQADVDQLTEEEFRKRKEAEFKRRSQAIQRNLPRPLDMNEAVLRPLNSNPPLTGIKCLTVEGLEIDCFFLSRTPKG